MPEIKLKERRCVNVRPEEIEIVRSMVAQGYGSTDIGHRIRRSHSSVIWIASQNGIAWPTREEQKRLRAEREAIEGPKVRRYSSGFWVGYDAARLTRAEIVARYAGRTYQDDARAEVPEPKVIVSRPSWQVDCGGSSLMAFQTS